MNCIDHGQKGNRDGYGGTTRKGVRRGLHVYTLMDKTGEEPNGRSALHTCDNTRCINPHHLYWGDQSQNMQDMQSRGRRRGGHRPKLTDEQVSYARHAVASGATQNSVARHLGVNPGTVNMLIHRRTYRHLP